MGSETLYTDIPLLLDFQYRIFERLLASSVLPLMCKEKLKLSYRTFVTVHPSNTLDNQCGATITDSSASSASLPLCKRAEEGKTTRDSLFVGKS